MHPHEEVPAIPLWINGRACLKLTSGFHDVRNPVNGETLRRIPLCGQVEVREALQSAQMALASWSAMDTSARKELLAALGNALSQLSGHFSRLIAEETGKDEKLAREEIASTVSLLRHAQEDGTTGIAAVAGTSLTISATSSLPLFLMPAFTPAALNPLGAVILPGISFNMLWFLL